MNIRRTYPILAAVTITLAGCITPEEQAARTQPVKVSVLKPSLTPLAETKSCQEKGGLEICIAPVTYGIVNGTKVAKRSLYERRKREYTLDGHVYETPVRVFERTTSSVPKIEPETVKFQLKIVNKLPRVWRGQGMVVQYNVAGKLHNVDPSRYANLVQMIVPPRNEQTVDFYGPPLSEIPASCPVGIFLYDVVTMINEKGEVVEKQNYEWYYNYATQIEEHEGTAPTRERIEEATGPRALVK